MCEDGVYPIAHPGRITTNATTPSSCWGRGYGPSTTRLHSCSRRYDRS